MTRRPGVPGTYRRSRLIPVASMATPSAPTPDAIRELGEKARTHIPALREHLRQHPELQAEFDQVRAAEADTAARLQQLATVTGHQPGYRTPVNLLTVLIAMLRAVEARCKHVDWPPLPTSPRMFVSITARAAICVRPACQEALRTRWHDDGLCELCEQPTDEFRSHITALGQCVVEIELCPECASLMGEGATP